MTTTVEQYVGIRAEALAKVVLTRRADVQLFTVSGSEDLGIDLIVQVSAEENKEEVIAAFGVQIMGTADPLPTEQAATKHGNQRWKHRETENLFLLPVLVLLFSMENDQGYYSWAMKPTVNKRNGPSLMRIAPLEFTKINRRSLNDIIDTVQTWYQAMRKILFRPAIED